MLSKAKSSPDITNYLTLILCNPPSALELSADGLISARSAAAVTLKNIVSSKYDRLSAEQKAFIQANVLRSVGDSNVGVRNLVGNVVTEIVKKGGVMAWPQVYSELFGMAGNEKGDVPLYAQEGAMSAIAKICEDSRKALNREYNGLRPLDEFMPRLYQLTNHSEARIRVLALETLTGFIAMKPKVIMDSLDRLLAQLENLARDQNSDVRRFVCRTFVLLVDVAPMMIAPRMDGLVEYMIAQQKNEDETDLALEAAEFWLAIGEQERLCDRLAPHIKKITPLLLASMVYSEDDIARHEGDRDDADEEDREQDIRPQFATARRAAVNSQSKENGAKAQDQNQIPPDDSLSEGEIPEEDELGDEDPEDEWNLRKCSAAALDSLASYFPNQIFEASLPYLEENLQHKEWPRREAAVLAFGAISTGCEEVVAPHLPKLIPFLLTLLSDSEHVVRKITCWALGRYTKWVVTLPEPNRSQYLKAIIEGVLERMLDRNKAVQEGAASAISNIEEAAKARLAPYALPITQQFVKCFDCYKDRNMYILYDCVQTMAEQVGAVVAQPEIQNILMPALIKRWNKFSDESQELASLLECLSYVVSAMGEAFVPYAQSVFDRCSRLIHSHLERQIMAARDPAMVRPSNELCVTSLDLLSSIVQALPQAHCAELVARSQPKVFDLLRLCLVDPNLEVRQSAYALLGDFAMNCFPLLKDHIASIMPVLINQLDVTTMRDEEAEEAFSVVNNACWACGESATQEDGKTLEPFVDQLYQRLLTLVNSADVTPTVAENAAIALGRLGLRFANKLAPQLAQFAKPLLTILEPVENGNEKGQSLLGLNMVIALDPQGMANCLVEYLKTAADVSQSKGRVANLLESFHHVSFRFCLRSFPIAYTYRRFNTTRAQCRPLTGKRSSPSWRQRNRRDSCTTTSCEAVATTFVFPGGDALVFACMVGH